MEQKNQDIKETIDIRDPKEESIILKKIESGIFEHPVNGKLLYKPDDEFELKSCCGSFCTVDKPFLEFLAKTVVSLSVLTFCFVQLSKGSQSEFASSTISLILGTYLGSTSASNNKNNKK